MDTIAADLDRHPRRTALWLSIAVGVVLVLLIALLATRDTGAREASTELIGKPAPAVTGTTLDGTSYDLGEHRGQWVLVNFFATWCVPCRLEHPQLVAFSLEHAETGDASVVSVAFDDEADAIESFFADEGGDWPVLAGDTGSIAVAYGVTGVPESYLVSPDGTVVAKWISGVEAAQVDATIAELEGRPS